MSEHAQPEHEPTPQDAAIAAFWADAKIRARLNPVDGYLGRTGVESMQPPAWAFGSDSHTADRLLQLVLEGRKTATASALRDYEQEARELAGAGGADELGPASGEYGEGDVLVRTDLDLLLPRPGMLNILLDGQGRPQALIRITDVQIVRFGDVSAEHAHREGEDDRTLRSWQHVHREFFTRSSATGEPVDDDTMVVLERFEVLVPEAAGRAARRHGLT